MKMSEEEIFFNLIFIVLLFAVIYPPKEFESAGFTIENMFSKYLGSESILFIQYHINRSCLILIIHSVLPIIYFMTYYLYFGGARLPNIALIQYFWSMLIILSFLLPIFTICLIAYYYKRNNWENHPIAKILRKYSNTQENRASWVTVAAEINNEFRRQEKLVKRFSAITKIIVTENWIMKTSLYFVNFAHQSDTALIAVNSDSHNISIHDTNDSVQFVNIEVKPTRNGVKSFKIRINSLDFKDLQDRLNRPITILSSVKFHTTIIDRFVAVFNEEIKRNPRFPFAQSNIADSCFACMVRRPDVKINKTCPDRNGEHNCTNCFCRPMWCSSCLARWFASRQEQAERETWLSSKASCPMCRSVFCVLDVCQIEEIESPL